MVVAALFTLVKESGRAFVNKRMFKDKNMLIYVLIYMLRYYLALQMKSTVICNRIKLENIMLSKIHQIKEDKVYIVVFVKSQCLNL